MTEEIGKPVQGFDVFVEKAVSGQHEEREWTFLRKDGQTLTVNLLVTASYDTNGAIIGFVGVAMDVTARKEAENQLKTFARRLSLATQALQAGVWDWDVRTDHIVWDEKMYELYGVLKNLQVNYQIWADAVVPEDLAEAAAVLQRVISSKSQGSAEFRIKLPDGSLRYILAAEGVVLDDAGQVAHVIGVNIDTSESKQAMIRQRELTERAQAADRAKGEFLANMSHEIRTPMNGVIGMTDLLLHSGLNPPQREFAETIRSSGEILLTIINDILDFSKIEAGKLVFEALDFDLVETVESPLEMLAAAAHAKGVELAGAIAPEVPRRLRGDPGRLRQILTNLICNAIKFTEKGEVVVRVGIADQTETHVMVRFNIEDTGIGISLAAQKAIFQPFSQADGSTTRKYGGTGLGLAIAKHLVTMMEGEIGVQSEAQEGSKFWFTAKFEKQPDLVIARKSQKFGDLRVLVVDDNITNLQILRQQLLAWRIQTDCAISGEESLRMIRDAASAGKPYDFALVDFQMPEMDGLALVRAIKSELDDRHDTPGHPDLPRAIVETHGTAGTGDRLVPEQTGQTIAPL